MRHLKRHVRPAQGFARELDFFGAQRLAVGFGGVGAVGRAFADEGFANDQGRLAVSGAFGLRNRCIDRVSVVAFDRTDDAPAVGGKALGRVVNEPRGNLAVNRDAVVVIQRDQLAKLPGTGQGGGFVADAFHQATVAHEDVGVVVDDLVAGAVELLREQLFSQRHADGVGHALAQRAGGGLDAGGVADFGVARRFAVQLAEVFQLFHGQRIARQVQQRVNQHGAVAVGQHKAVAVQPVRVGRVVLQMTRPQGHRHVGHAHGRAGVAGVGLLDGVHGQGTDGVGHERRGVVSHLRVSPG